MDTGPLCSSVKCSRSIKALHRCNAGGGVWAVEGFRGIEPGCRAPAGRAGSSSGGPTLHSPTCMHPQHCKVFIVPMMVDPSQKPQAQITRMFQRMTVCLADIVHFYPKPCACNSDPKVHALKKWDFPHATLKPQVNDCRFIHLRKVALNFAAA